MFELEFYEDERGHSDVREFIEELEAKASTSKDARINRNKVVAYLDALEEMGTRVGMPVTRHLEGEIWELRPLSNRILYAYYKDNKFLLLHSQSYLLYLYFLPNGMCKVHQHRHLQ